MASSNAPSRLAGTLTFTAITTAEIARQRIAGAAGEVLTDLKIERIHAKRTAGAGTVAFTVRIYDAAAAGNAYLDADLTLAAFGGGVDTQQAVQGYDALFESGAWLTVEGASGSGHGVDVTVQYTSARG